MAPAAVTSALTVSGLPEWIVTPAPAPVALIGPLTVMPCPAAVLPWLEMFTSPPPVFETPVIASAAGVPAVTVWRAVVAAYPDRVPAKLR